MLYDDKWKCDDVYCLSIYASSDPSSWLVVSTPLKNMNSSVGMIIPNIWNNKTCSKPPTRNN